jgi:hypothetical protein
MYVYRTSGFNEKAELYGIQARIDDLCAELETLRIDEVQARFERVYPYLKRRTLNRRLIARLLRVDDEQLLCLLDIFKRGDNDYEQFLESPIEYGRTYLEPQLNEQRLREWLLEQKNKQQQAEQLPELPSELRPWLEPPGWEMETLTEDWVIYESEEWVTRFRKSEIEDAWETYYQIVSGIRAATMQAEEFPELPNVKLCTLNNHYVLYSQLETVDRAVGGVLFLLAPFERKPTPEEIIEVGNKTALFDGSVLWSSNWALETGNLEDYAAQATMPAPEVVNDSPYNLLAEQLSLSDLTPFARRSYPSYLLADEQSWLAIERGKEANLALSAEEELILKSVSTAAPGNGSLPLFINGRAGSGKSTMLLYLFADYCYRKYYDKRGRRRDNPLPGEPLFLTYNERLLEVAKQGVKTLLSSHHRFVSERSEAQESDRIDHFFQPFQKFLFNLLPIQERSRFDPEKYISFHRFKQLYQGKSPCESLAKVVLHLPQARRYSPEICWHVIRSFIKGYGLEEHMTPEDYQEEVPRKERTISLEKFQGVYDTIWERWYKRITQEQGYWDDQDLIARVLELKCYRPEYTAIFCDEAQDFTRLELQLIMRLSMFSRYNLGYQPIQSLPFAFAGDPFQTLNPTGFHWSSVQAAFDAEVITALDPADQLKLAINFQALAFNYRSSPPIVQVTNLIQLWRHVLFDIHELQPQTAWHPGNFAPAQKFILNQNINPEQLATYIKDTIIIVPCEEGEEAAYAHADEVLSEIFPQQESTGDSTNNQQPIKNVLSAIAAKGLEFKKVILYKFGEECNQNVWNIKGKDTDQRVKVEYFFNKLYVAASRATEHLFVVDSEKGDRQLWDYASNEGLLQAMLRFARSQERWENSVQTLSTGTPRTIQQLREDDPGAIAHEFETKGLNAQNPDLLRRAKQFYSDLGDTPKADFCEAWALKFEEQFLNAGNRFVQLGRSQEAWECYWRGMCWQELVDWYKQHGESDAIERSLAIFMVAQADDQKAIDNFTSLVRNQWSVVTSNSKQLIDHKQWKKAIEKYANSLETLLTVPDLKPNQWQQFGEVLETLRTSGYNEFDQLVGECFYHAENYQLAIHYWDASGATQKPEYNRAKAMLLGIPEGLEYLAQAGEHDSITLLWEQAGRPRDRSWLQYVAPALEANQQYQQAFVVYIWLDELVKVKECFELASQEAPQIKLLTVLLQYFYRKKHWSDAIEAIERYLPNVIGSERQKTALKCEVVYEIAGSELMPEDITKEERKRYKKLIKEQVLSTQDWNQYLLMQQVGVALEKIGSLVETLEFYEQFVSYPDSQLSQFARERWIATKKKQEEHARNQGQIDKASKSQTELLKKAQSWSIDYQVVPLEPPLPPRERPTEQILDPRATLTGFSTLPTITKLVIKGLPVGTKVEQIEGGVVRFGVRHLVIKVMKQSKQVLITDALNRREVRVDGAQSKVTIGEATVESVGGDRLSFTLSTSGYSGTLIKGGAKPRLELNVQGLSSKISLEL